MIATAVRSGARGMTREGRSKENWREKKGLRYGGTGDFSSPLGEKLVEISATFALAQCDFHRIAVTARRKSEREIFSLRTY